jgi:glutathione peroxidase
LFSKIDVNGKDTCPVYQFLRNNSELYDAKKKEAKEIPWNFAKFIVDRNGKVVSYHNPKVDPNDLIKNIEEQTCH